MGSIKANRGIVKEYERVLSSSQAVASMLIVQVFATGMQLLSQIILSHGAFVFALMAYRHVVAALCVSPFAFFFERNARWKLSWLVFFWLFVNALIGITLAMGLYYYGLRDTGATYAVNILNLVPILTFAFSILARIEKLGLETRAGKIKSVGAILCVAGALTTSLCKGKSFKLSQHGMIGHHVHVHVIHSDPHRLRGSLMLIGSCLSYSIWYILQVKVLKVLPLKYSATMLTCIVASLQSAIIGLCINRSESAWRIEWNLQLVTILYSGALATAATFCLICWTVAKRGPAYPSMFNPLTVIFVAFSEALLFGAEINVGTLIGMVLIIVGLYSFLWGKKKEMAKQPPAGLPKAEQVEAVPTIIGSAGNQLTNVATVQAAPSSAARSIIDNDDGDDATSHKPNYRAESALQPVNIRFSQPVDY